MRKPLGNQFYRGDQPLPFREAVRVGDVVYLSGQLAFGEHGEIVGETVSAQVQRCVANISDVLERCGLTLDDVFKVTAWVSNSEDFPSFNEAFAAAFGDILPVRSTVRADLLAPGALVELEVTAVARSG